MFESDPKETNRQITIRRQGVVIEQEEENTTSFLKTVLRKQVLPVFVKWLQSLRWMAMSVPSFNQRFVPDCLQSVLLSLSVGVFRDDGE